MSIDLSREVLPTPFDSTTMCACCGRKITILGGVIKRSCHCMSVEARCGRCAKKVCHCKCV